MKKEYITPPTGREAYQEALKNNVCICDGSGWVRVYWKAGGLSPFEKCSCVSSRDSKVRMDVIQ